LKKKRRYALLFFSSDLFRERGLGRRDLVDGVIVVEARDYLVAKEDHHLFHMTKIKHATWKEE